MKKQQMYLYLISHNKKDIKTHTYIGCAKNFVRRLKQHNAELEGGPRITRRASGSWRPVLVLKLAADRTFSSKMLKREWKSSSRGLESRIRKGFELAQKYEVPMFLSKTSPHKTRLLTMLNRRWNDANQIHLKQQEWNNIINGMSI